MTSSIHFIVPFCGTTHDMINVSTNETRIRVEPEPKFKMAYDTFNYAIQNSMLIGQNVTSSLEYISRALNYRKSQTQLLIQNIGAVKMNGKKKKRKQYQ